jgi:hypothetical protein
MAPVANLSNIPSDVQSVNEYAFSLQAQIRDINRVIFEDSGITLPEYVIDPLNIDNPNAQLQQLQIMADNIGDVLNIAGYDLEDVDLSDQGQRASWVWLVFTFFKQASDQLHIG